mgnify:CR=1 FL=1
MKKNDLREKIHLTSVDELFGLENAESSIEIGIDRIRSFKDHPFKVLDDDKMADLVESIKANGVLTPVLLIMPLAFHPRANAEEVAARDEIPARPHAARAKAPTFFCTDIFLSFFLFPFVLDACRDGHWKQAIQGFFQQVYEKIVELL